MINKVFISIIVMFISSIAFATSSMKLNQLNIKQSKLSTPVYTDFRSEEEVLKQVEHYAETIEQLQTFRNLKDYNNESWLDRHIKRISKAQDSKSEL